MGKAPRRMAVRHSSRLRALFIRYHCSTMPISPMLAKRIGVGAVRPAQHGPVHGPERLAVRSEVQASPDLHVDGGVPHLEVAPLAVEPVLVRVRRIDLQHVHVDEVRVVDGVGPAQVAVVAVQDHGGAGEEAAHHVPALFRADARLVPGHGPAPGLV